MVLPVTQRKYLIPAVFFCCLAERSAEDYTGGMAGGKWSRGQFSQQTSVLFITLLRLFVGRFGKGGLLCIYHLGGYCVGEDFAIDCDFQVRFWRGIDFTSRGDVLFHSEKKSCMTFTYLLT